MFFNLFTEYLLSEKKISESDFELVKQAQTKTRVKLGLIAVSEKMITEKQADEINRKQAVLDKRFGDIAVDLGYLTADQVSRLLELQGNPYMLFSQAITDNNIMSLADVEASFDAFIKSNGFGDAAAVAIKNDDIDNIIPLYVDGASENMVEIISVAIRTLNRLISTDLSIKKGYKADSYKYDFLAAQSLEGDFNVKLSISGGKEGALKIASIFAREEFDQIDLDSLDSMGEFINIVNGLFATALSYRKIQVELMAPEYSENAGEMAGDIFVIPLKIEQKEFELVVNCK